MSAPDKGGRDPPKPKGKTLGSFFGSLPGFSSARNLMAGAHSSAKEARPVADPTGASAQPQTEATNLDPTERGEKLPPPSDKMISGAKDLVCSKMTKTKGAISSGMANMVDTAKGVMQGGLDMTRSALMGTKETVATGVTGAVDVAKGTVQTGLDTTKTVVTGTKDTVCSGVTSAMNVAKGAVQTGMDTTKTVVTGTKDTVSTGLTGAVNMAKGTVQTSLDTSKTVLTGTKDAVSTGVTGAANMAKGALQTGLNTTQNIVTGTKDTMCSGVTGAMNVAKGAVQTGMDTSKAILTGTKDTVSTGLTGAVGVAKGTVQTGLNTTKTVLTGTKDTVCSGVTGAMNVAKGAVQTGMDTTKTVLTGTKDAVSTGLTGAVNMAKGTVQTGLDTTKTVVTGTKDTVSTGLTGAVNMAKGTVQTGLDTTKTVLTGTKDTVCSGVTGAMNVAKGAAHTGMDTSKAILTGTKDAVSTGLTGAGSVAKEAVQTVQNWLPGTQDSVWSGLTSYRAPGNGREQAILRPQEALSSGFSSAPDTLCASLDLAREATAVATGTHGAPLGRENAGHEGAMSFVTLRDELGELGEIFCPMDAGEQAQLAASEPGPKVLTADRGSYFVRLGDLAPRFRQRAFEHGLSHLQHGQFQARAALAQLEESFELIEKAKQAPEGQSRADQGLSSRVEEGAPQEVLDSRALSRACGLIQQLHVAYSTLASSLQGLPSELQQQVGRARHGLCELYGLVSSASSVGELPAERLAQSRGAVGQAWRELEQMLESVQHGPPLCWLVGPFALHPTGQQL
ncbi:perilipin-4 isoform X5 [Lontra canadensis]|uniref:perilipin-4 isoform X5 n=1 Tax=Lontra canadensis TaxID=76717 RepID=UPI0013F2DBC0|nr:perilipin-4 isoform X5 [Lontra canadensis]